MEFRDMRAKMIEHFNSMVQQGHRLFEVDLDKDELWNLYLDSFPAGTNEVFRERRKHDCSCCRSFMKSIGNTVFIVNNEVHTIWEFRTDDFEYQPVLSALDAFVKSKAVSDVFVTNERRIGTMQNYEYVDDGRTLAWDHFYLDIPAAWRPRNSLIGDAKNEFRTAKSVFKRSLDEIPLDAIDTVLELINSNTLYRGQEWKANLTTFRALKKEYDELPESHKDNFAWVKSLSVGGAISKIRNNSIGVLLINIASGMDLDAAVRAYEAIVAPANYKRPKAIFTARMLEDAKKTITDLGYMESLGRRFATLDDITVNNILFANRNAAKRISGAGDVFDEMAASVSKTDPKKFSKVEEITAEKFVTDVLPSAKEVEVFVENRHAENMVSLIAPKNIEAKTMFKWNNNFSWAYTGNMTDSMKERVKAAGGKVDGDLRFSIQWNESGDDNCDLDAHCTEASGEEIYFRTCKAPRRSRTEGQLDVDIIYPGSKVAVENIAWPTRARMTPGIYRFFVHQFSGRAKKGFRAEIEFDGQLYSFDYNNPVRSGEYVFVANVTLSPDGKFSIKELIPSSAASKEVWGITTNNFVPVSVIMHSPNYWDEQDGIGHKHYFFMLKDCVNPENPNGFYNEFLKQDLDKHKRVFEALGGKMAVENVEDQLSGLGFSATKRNDVVVKVKGATERIMRIKF